MKDIGEVFNTVKTLESELKEIKQRYDKHAGFKLRAQRNHLHLVPLSKINLQKICCPNSEIEFCSYPFYSSLNFARCIQVRCCSCGMAWVPSLDFDLTEYYTNDYASLIQPFRLHTGNFYNKDNLFFESQAYDRMKKRAQKHLYLLGDSSDKSILELGPGVGIALKESVANKKFAYELDKNSHTILKDEIGVECVDIFEQNINVDMILASHFIEHLFIDDLPSILNRCHELLNRSGKLVIEVPRGADAVLNMANGSRGRVIFEPHTISFSAYSLVKILSSSGFKVMKLSIDSHFNDSYIEKKEELMKKLEILEDPNLLIVCEKNNT